MKFLETLKKVFLQNIPLKLLAAVLAVVCVVILNAVS